MTTIRDTNLLRSSRSNHTADFADVAPGPRSLMISVSEDRRDALTIWGRVRAMSLAGVARLDDGCLVTRHEFGNTVCVEPLEAHTTLPLAEPHQVHFWETFFHALLQAPAPTLDPDTGVQRASSLVRAQLHNAGIREDDVNSLRRATGPGDTLLAVVVEAEPETILAMDGDAVCLPFPVQLEQAIRSADARRRRTIRRASTPDGFTLNRR